MVPSRPPAFEFLLGLVDPAEPLEVQRAAAENIRRGYKAEAQSHRKEVEAVRATVQDKTVARLLDEVIGIAEK